jgi:hypothetical protein
MNFLGWYSPAVNPFVETAVSESEREKDFER